MTQRKVTTRTIPYAQLVREVDPVTDLERPPVVYNFSRNRQFVDSGPKRGPYGPPDE